MTDWPKHENGTPKKLTEMNASERAKVARESYDEGLHQVLTDTYAKSFDLAFERTFGVNK